MASRTRCPGQEDRSEKLMVLLSGVLERTVSVLERIEARLDASAACSKPAAVSVTKSQAFTYYIKDKAKAGKLMEYLHRHIDELYRVDAYLYLQAAIGGNALSRPPYAAAESEFPGHLGSDSMYNQYVGDADQFSTKRRKTDLELAIQEIRELMK